MQTFNFTPVFTDSEDVAIDWFDFNFQMQKQVGVARVVLKNGATTLATIIASPSTPSVNVITPTFGSTISGMTTISWNGSDSDSGSTLTYNVLFSADGGLNWLPVVAGITTTSVTVNADNLPATTIGKVQEFLVCTDDG